MRVGLIGGVISWALIILASTIVSGCAVPLLTGVKTYQSGDTRIEFITGADFRLGANGIDSVRDTRGIDPRGGAKN